MVRKSLGILGVCWGLSLPLGCATGPSAVTAREVASAARVYVEVEQHTIMAPGLQSETLGKIKEHLLASRQGVPVTNRESADLVISVHIRDVNFTHATGWDWSVLDSSGALVLAKTDTSAFGSSGDAIATQVVGALATIDTNAYAGGATPATVPVVQATSTSQFPSSETQGKDAWAVVIGVEKYRESLPAATGAERDAKAFAEFAQKTLNVPEANIKVLLGDRASKADITAALYEWLPRNAVNSGGKVYVYFSGHGAPDVENGSSFLVPYDGNPTYIRSGGLAVSELQTAMGKLKEQQVYVFLDSCFSGSGERSVLPEGTRPLVPVKEIEKTEVVTFTASGARETTGAHPTSGHGLFTHYLIDGLKGAADQNKDANVSITELDTFVVEGVRVEARRQNREQNPVLVMPTGVQPNQVIVQTLR